MKKTTLIAVAVVVALLTAVVVVSAQGPAGLSCPRGYVQPNPNATGPGQGAGYVRMGLPCPYGNVPQGPNAAGRTNAYYGPSGQPCPYGYAQPNPNAGGWWTRVNPTTPEQKAFVDKVTQLHNQIRDKNFQAAALRASNGDPKQIAALEKDVENLQTELHDYMYKNWNIRQQLGPGGRGATMGPGRYGWQRMGGANYNTRACPCVSDPTWCENCPYYDQCQCPQKQVSSQQQNRTNAPNTSK